MALRFPPNGTQSLWTSCHDFEKGTQSTCFQHLFCIFYIQISPMLQKMTCLQNLAWSRWIAQKGWPWFCTFVPLQNYFQSFATGQQAGSTPGQLACTSLKHGFKQCFQHLIERCESISVNIPCSHRHRFRLQVSNFVGSVVICCNIDLSSS